MSGWSSESVTGILPAAEQPQIALSYDWCTALRRARKFRGQDHGPLAIGDIVTAEIRIRNLEMEDHVGQTVPVHILNMASRVAVFVPMQLCGLGSSLPEKDAVSIHRGSVKDAEYIVT